MRIRLHGFIEDFAETALNAFDLDFWKTATHLASFGVELQVRRGFAEIELRLFRDGRTPTLLHRLSQSGAGSTYSPPYFPAEMSGVILPVVTGKGMMSDFSVSFGTNDLPPTPNPKICFVTGGAAATAHRVAFGRFIANAHRLAGDDAHLLIVGDSAIPDRDRTISVLDPDPAMPAPFARAAGEIAFGALSGHNFSHLCVLDPDVSVHPEMFARLNETIRFLKPGHIPAAARHPGHGDGGTVPGPLTGPAGGASPDNAAWPLAFAGAGIALDDIAACRHIDRLQDVAVPGMVAIPLAALRSIGLPDPYLSRSPMTDYAGSLAQAGYRAAVPLSLAVTGPAPVPAGDAAALRQSWREHLGSLLSSGRIGDLKTLRQRVRTLAGLVGADSARALIAALADVMTGPGATAAQVPAPAPTPPRRSMFRARKAEAFDTGPALEALLRDAPELTALSARFAESRARATDPLARLGTGSDRDREQALWKAVLATHRRLDALRTELTAMNVALANQIDDRFHHTGIENPARTRSDLERASGLALAACENRHRGQKAVIVGNGPSLRISDLERLSGCVTFGSNKIFLAFAETNWRPTYYSVEDHLILTNNFDTISKLRGVTKIFPDNMRDYGYHAPDTIFVRRIPPKSWQDPLSDPNFPRFSFDLVEGLHWGSTIVYSQLQMAVFMGCTEIYLIGVDHSYTLPKDRQANTYVSEGEHNHFHKDYFKPGELWHQPNLDILDVSYRRAHEVCARHGIQVMNASRRTLLEAFPRVDFDTVFPG